MYWIIANKEWLFSGLGLSVISLFVFILSKNKKNNENHLSTNSSLNIIDSSITGNINFTLSDINIDKKLAEQINYTYFAILQMPQRINEAISKGDKCFSFDESRKALEDLYILAISYNKTDLSDKILAFQTNFNGYIKLLNEAVAGNSNLNEINIYHKTIMLDWFNNNIIEKYIKYSIRNR